MRLLMVILALGPSALFCSFAYLLRNPDDWTAPAVLLPMSLLLTIATQAGIFKRIQQMGRGDLREIMIAAQVGGVVPGDIVRVMTYFILLDG